MVSLRETHPALRPEVESKQPHGRARVVVGAVCAAGLVAVLVVSQGLDARLRPPELVQTRYWVKPGDTVSGIAARLRVPGGTEAIVAMNGLVDPHVLRPGQMLRVVARVDRLGAIERPFANEIAPAPSCPVIEYDRSTGDEPGCLRLACRTSTGGTRACHCWAEYSAVILREPGEPVVRVPVPQTSGLAGANLMAGEIDLDGDGARELALALHTGTSNGIALRYYHVIILDGTDRRVRVSFTTIGWGVAADEAGGRAGLSGLFLRTGGENGASHCAVAPAWFERLHDPVLGSGHYLAQRLYRYGGGELRASRLDLRVLRNHEAARLQRWPVEVTEGDGSRFVIRRVEAVDAETTRMVVRLDGESTDDTIEVSRIRDGCSGMFLPEGYRPASWSALANRRGRLLCAGPLEPGERCAIAIECGAAR